MYKIKNSLILIIIIIFIIIYYNKNKKLNLNKFFEKNEIILYNNIDKTYNFKFNISNPINIKSHIDKDTNFNKIKFITLINNLNNNINLNQNYISIQIPQKDKYVNSIIKIFNNKNKLELTNIIGKSGIITNKNFVCNFELNNINKIDKIIILLKNNQQYQLNNPKINSNIILFDNNFTKK